MYAVLSTSLQESLQTNVSLYKICIYIKYIHTCFISLAQFLAIFFMLLANLLAFDRLTIFKISIFKISTFIILINFIRIYI